MNEAGIREQLVRDERRRLLIETDRRRRSVRRRAVVALVAAGMVLTTAAGATLAWVVAPHSGQKNVRCFTAPDLASVLVEAAYPDGVEVSDRVASAADICGSVWAAGILGPSGRQADLFVCRGLDGALQVFPAEPGRDDCDAIGSVEPDQQWRRR